MREKNLVIEDYGPANEKKAKSDRTGDLCKVDPI